MIDRHDRHDRQDPQCQRRKRKEYGHGKVRRSIILGN